MTVLSILDLSPVVQGSDVGQALRNTVDLARHGERLGYNRFWLAEHHNMPGIASAATAVVIGQAAGATSTIRVGSGGIMLPNHAPLVIAEQFGTLASLFPGRIDLGVGRAPGTDQLTARALRRTLVGDVDRFPQDVLELIGFMKPAQDNQMVVAYPGEGTEVPVWILGSSTYGAQLAAILGLPYSYASHFARDDLDAAVAVYRAEFKPSEFLEKPYLMLGVSVLAADTDEEARFLYSSAQQSFLWRRLGRRGRLPPPIENIEGLYEQHGAGSPWDMQRGITIVGGPDTVRKGLDAFIARYQPDELIVATQAFEHAKRVRSYEILADIQTAWAEAA